MSDERCPTCGGPVVVDGGQEDTSSYRPAVGDEVVEEHARYRAALIRIADAESGSWGPVAREALWPEDRR